MWKLTLIVGAGIGYVLGARAGRERYEQMARAARQFAQNPKVRDAAGKAKHQAESAACRAANAAAGKVGDRLPDAFTDRVPYFQRHRAEDDSWGTVRP